VILNPVPVTLACVALQQEHSPGHRSALQSGMPAELEAHTVVNTDAHPLPLPLPASRIPLVIATVAAMTPALLMILRRFFIFSLFWFCRGSQPSLRNGITADAAPFRRVRLVFRSSPRRSVVVHPIPDYRTEVTPHQAMSSAKVWVTPHAASGESPCSPVRRLDAAAVSEPRRITSASHAVTNDVIFKLITDRISPGGRVVDYGAGQGSMSQRIGNWFEGHGVPPRDHLIPCEIVPEIFQYHGVECRRITGNSDIPVEDHSVDLIYCIEVLEHVGDPYGFLRTAFSKLKPGGHLIFSVPNILHFSSRIQFLLTGFAEMFGPPSTLDRNAGRICGHIMPLGYPYFVYGLRKAGFSKIRFSVDRRKRGSLVGAVALYPLLWLMTRNYGRTLRKYDAEVWAEHRDTVRHTNSIDVLSSRSCILSAVKPA
jgi:2-polyprenyl-3-methyl-5-hydroxy-6-metoxy-1,4-benzoquinol methylase